MKIYFAGDHAGFELKKELIEFVRSLGYETEDLGPFSYDANDDYPDFVIPLAKRIAENPPPTPSFIKEGAKGADFLVRGIIIGGSGQGEAIVANRFAGVRAVVYYGGNLEVVRKMREHNDANILSLGARFMSEEEAKTAVKLWLETPFSGDERHMRRLAKIDAWK
ncbi:MAG: ribose 5-phosphate isomerase B [Parcubacteria group bacterium Gr01-1014_17]|nr:MAG: ribose 5-phosphate isomerase B [Parcubacteria group bacterium Gr01-1014_17]